MTVILDNIRNQPKEEKKEESVVPNNNHTTSIDHVFVYGTLKKGCYNSYLLDGAESVGTGLLKDHKAFYYGLV